MASLGPNNPATASGWVNSTFVFASDDSRATDFIAFGTIGGVLSVTNFSFSVPAGSTLNGILMEYERSATGTGAIEDYEIKLTGVTGASANKAVAGTWTPADAYVSRGGSSDLWSTTPTVSEINSTTFGVLITAQETTMTNDATARIDHVRITVYFTPATRSIAPGIIGARPY